MQAPAPPVTPTTVATATPAHPDSVAGQDALAGLSSSTVRWQGEGSLRIVPGRTSTAGAGRLVRVRVDVERGIGVDGPAFAAFVLATLNDSRSWSHAGARHFARVDGSGYDVRVVLASPATSARMCRPLVTYGKLSCGVGSTAVLTMYRWVNAMPEYGRDRTGYRHYVVNHEVGHTLGKGHQMCPGAGRRAPVMMQQTKGLKGCRPNSWPYP